MGRPLCKYPTCGAASHLIFLSICTKKKSRILNRNKYQNFQSRHCMSHWTINMTKMRHRMLSWYCWWVCFWQLTPVTIPARPRACSQRWEVVNSQHDYLFFRADGVDTGKEAGDTVVADGDKITDVRMNYTRQKKNFHPYRSAASILVV